MQNIFFHQKDHQLQCCCEPSLDTWAPWLLAQAKECLVGVVFARGLAKAGCITQVLCWTSGEEWGKVKVNFSLSVEELNYNYSLPSLLPGRSGQAMATLSFVLQPLCSAPWELSTCTFYRAVKWTVRGNRLQDSFNWKRAPVFLGEGGVCLSLLSTAWALPRRPFRHLIVLGGALRSWCSTHSAGSPGARGGRLGVSPGVLLPAPLSTPGSLQVPWPDHLTQSQPQRGKEGVGTDNFLYADNWVCISLVLLSGWNAVSWLIMKWSTTCSVYMNLLLVRACSDSPAVSMSITSLPFSSLALKSCCLAEVRNDSQVLGQRLVWVWCMTGLLQQGGSSAWSAWEGWKKVT